MEINFNKNINSKKMYNITNENDDRFNYHDYIDISLGDPISSLFLNEKYVIIGTMMGRIKLLNLKEDNENIINLNNVDLEQISGLSFIEENNMLYASVGDERIISYYLREPLDKQIKPESPINLYDNISSHNLNCDNTYVLMSTENLLKIKIFIPELEEKIKDNTYFDYEVIYFNKCQNNSQNSKGKIKSTNYYVPLHFDGIYFCWVEYLNDKKDRNVCIQNVLESQIIDNPKFKFKVDNNYGHISHAKLINNKIFIVHQLNKCEIRNFVNKFELIESFTHRGDEVYAVDILLHEGNTLYDEDSNDNNKVDIKKNVYQSYAFNDDKLYKGLYDEKLNENKKLKGKKWPKNEQNRNIRFKMTISTEIKADSLSLLRTKTKKKNNDALTIITLDIDGNVNKYEKGIEEVLFNLYDIKNIIRDHKDKKYFSMGYVYYIKTDLTYFCITTDHGCYIIKRNE